MDTSEKVRENRLRRAAERQGLTLSRSRRRDPLALDYGKYWLTRPDGTMASQAEGSTLDEIARFLESPR